MPSAKKYYGLIVLLSITLGFLVPSVGKVFTPSVVPMLMLMMFLSCLKISPTLVAREIKKNWWRYGVLLVLVFLLPPAIAFLFRSALDPLIFGGLLIVAAAPAGIATVLIADILGGEPSDALVMTTVAHLASPLITPALVWLFGHTVITVSFGAIAISILKLVIIPFALAQFVRSLGWEKSFAPHVTFLNLILLALINMGLIAPAVPLIFGNLTQVYILAGAILTILVIEGSISIWFGRTKKEDITWSVIDIFKNYTVPAVVAAAVFGPIAVLGPVVYSIMNSLAGIPLQVWANRSQKSIKS